jgi:hypothetical protein
MLVDSPFVVGENRYSEFANRAKPSHVDYQLVAAKAQMLSQKASTLETFTNLFYDCIVVALPVLSV